MSETLHSLLSKIVSKCESTADKGTADEKGAVQQDEAVEMAKALCSLSETVSMVNASSRAEADELDTEGKDIGVEKAISNGQFVESSTDFGNEVKEEEEEDVKNPLDQPISVKIDLSAQVQSEKIFNGANFASFADFKHAFEEWKLLYQHPFRVASSEKHEDQGLAARFKYRYVVYHCSRYGEPRKRGQGRRPHQNYLPCGCLAKLRLNYHPQNEGSLCVTTLHTEHNHEPLLELLGNPAKRRRSSPEDDESLMSGEPSPSGTLPPLLSPLSLQPALHNSPSSGGQSSTECGGGATEAAVATGGQQHQRHHPPPFATQTNARRALASPRSKNGSFVVPPSPVEGLRQQQLVQPVVDQKPNHHQQQQGPAGAGHLLMRSNQLDEFLRGRQPQASGTTDQQKAALLPLLQELLRRGAEGQTTGGRQQNNPLALLGLLSTTPHKERPAAAVAAQRQPPPPTANPFAASPSALLAAIHQQQQPPMQQGQPSSASSLLSVLQQLQLLSALGGSPAPSISRQQQSSQQQSDALLQMLAGLGQPNPSQQQFAHQRAAGGTEMGRAEMIREADFLLQTLVGQMIRTKDLGTYLARLRHFLSEMCD